MFKNYNMNQIVLPLDLAIILQENDIAFMVHDLVEQIPQEAFASFIKRTGCPAYHPRMMMKIILCAYTQSVFSGRKIEALLKDSVRMMWLAQDYQPTYRTINRFRVHPDAQALLRECFVQFRCHLVEKQQIDQEAIFIDGTKIEANANKFTFVWRKSVEKYSRALVEKSSLIYDDLVQQTIIPAIEKESPEELSASELTEVAKKLDEVVEELTQKIEASEDAEERKKLRSERKLPKQWYKQFQDFLLRKQKYAQDMVTFGERNSYSKTDPDATFMRMKDDYMKNGQLKAGYNVQIATEGQYTLAYDVFPNPTDTRTFIPFLDQIEQHFFQLPFYIVADAGYGSEENYQNVIENRKSTPLITYNMHRKELTKKYKKDEFNIANWHYDPLTDAYTCPNGQRLTFRHLSHKTDRYDFTREYKVYECESCDDCPLRANCTKAKEGNHRKILHNENWEQQKVLIRALLSEAKTGEIYAKRKIDVEPVFGFLKANLGFTRFSVRGKERVTNEMGFALMAVNLRKLAASSAKIA